MDKKKLLKKWIVVLFVVLMAIVPLVLTFLWYVLTEENEITIFDFYFQDYTNFMIAIGGIGSFLGAMVSSIVLFLIYKTFNLQYDDKLQSANKEVMKITDDFIEEMNNVWKYYDKEKNPTDHNFEHDYKKLYNKIKEIYNRFKLKLETINWDYVKKETKAYVMEALKNQEKLFKNEL